MGNVAQTLGRTRPAAARPGTGYVARPADARPSGAHALSGRRPDSAAERVSDAHVARKRLADRRAWRCRRSSAESRAIGTVGAIAGSDTRTSPMR